MNCHTAIPRTLGLVILGVLMTVMSYFLTKQPGLYERAGGWVGIPLFAFATFMAFRQLLRRSPTVIINDTGLLDHRLGIGEIPWGDILEFAVVENHGARYIKLRLRNEPSYVAQMPPLTRTVSGGVRGVGLSPFCISFAGLSPGLEQALPLIEQRVGSALSPNKSLERRHEG
jgi:hypothetical protein